MIEEFQRELSTMQTWYDLASEKSTGLTPGVSGLSVQQIKDLFADFINGRIDTQEIMTRRFPTYSDSPVRT